MSNNETFQLARLRRSRLLTSGAAILAFAGGIQPAFAAIDNTATVSGTYNAAPVPTAQDGESVPVAAPNQVLTATKSGVINNTVVGDTDIEAGDTITYTVNIKNDGNVTMTGVTPADLGVTFNAVASSGTMGSFAPASATLAPGADQDFVVTYTLSAADIANAAAVTDGVSNDANAGGTGPGGATTSNTANELLTIPADPELAIVKTSSITTDNGTVGSADFGDVITYTYTVTNTGNVPITAVSVADDHEGAVLPVGALTSPWNEVETTPATLANSSDAGPDGVWDTLGAGGVVTFTYVHTVTQTEFDNQ